MDFGFLLLLSASFGAFVATHVALLIWLFRQQPRSRAWLSLLLPPLAPYCGLRARALGLSLTWVVTAFTYVISLAVAID